MTTRLPTQLVDDQGKVAFGRFASSLARINGRAARYLTPLGQPASALARRFHYKQFQYFGLISERFLMGCAFADTTWLGLVFVYVYDVERDKLQEWTWRSPLGRALTLSDSPRQGDSHFERGRVRIQMRYEEQADGTLIKHLQLAMPELQVEASLPETGFSPMSLCTRTGINGFTYANKVAGVAATGTLSYQGKRHSLTELGAYGHHDFSAGYMRRETFWNWACTSANIDGHALGLNISCGVNETSFSENCLWLDGRLIPLGGVHFDYQREDLMRPWHISDAAGQLELEFIPSGCHREALDVTLFASNFHQLFGRFNGRLHTDAGALDISGLHGFVEEQYAKW